MQPDTDRRASVIDREHVPMRLHQVFVAAALVPAAALAQPDMLPPAAAPVVIAGTRLDVVARGEAVRVPDVATITAGVVTQASKAEAAMSDNARRMAGARDALRRAGVSDRDIRTASLNLQPQYRYGENQPPVLTGYQASNQLSVRFRDVARAGTILDTLVEQGLNQIAGPELSVDLPEPALDEARTKAVAAARARAELYAKAAGMRVARILSISEMSDVSPPVRPVMMMARAARVEADTVVEPGEQRLEVTVSVSFELR
jgi:uncharacterized protein